MPERRQPELDETNPHDSPCESFLKAELELVEQAPVTVDDLVTVTRCRGEVADRQLPGLNGYEHGALVIRYAPDDAPETTGLREMLLATVADQSRSVFIQSLSIQVELEGFGAVDVRECRPGHLFLGPITRQQDELVGERRHWLLLKPEDLDDCPALTASLGREAIAYQDHGDPTTHNGRCVVVPFGARSHRHV